MTTILVLYNYNRNSRRTHRRTLWTAEYSAVEVG